MHDDPQSAEKQQPYFLDTFKQLGVETFVTRVIAVLAKEGLSLVQEGEQPYRVAMGTSLLKMVVQMDNALLEYHAHKLQIHQTGDVSLSTARSNH